MDLTEQYKESIERKIVEAIISALDKKEIQESELSQIAGMVLDGIDKVSSQDQLIDFLTTLSDRWTIFKNILEIEKGQIKSVLEKKTADDVLQLANTGNIEEAIRLAKTVTQQT
jgi:hypothetical protein